MADHRAHLFWEIILAIILPPLGVALKFGCCSCKFWISVLLTLLGYIPGIIFAIYVIVVKGERNHSNHPEGLYYQVPG